MRRVALEHTASKHLWSMSMKTPPNPFKQALQQKTPQVGLWLSLVNPDAAEIAGLAGFDWLVVDGEHAPYDLQSIKTQLQVLAAYPDSHPVVRVPVGDTALIKQFLDVGVRNLLVPMVDTPEQAALCVKAMRYPPEGIRGVGAALAREYAGESVQVEESDPRAWQRNELPEPRAFQGTLEVVELAEVASIETVREIASARKLEQSELDEILRRRRANG
jgi:hypothetical protein